MAPHSSILAWRIPMDRGARQATVRGVTESQTRLSKLTHSSTGVHPLSWPAPPHQSQKAEIVWQISLWFFSLWDLLEFDITTYLFSSFPMILRRKRRRKRNFLLNIFFWGHFSVLNGSSLLTSITLNLYIFQSIFVYIFSFLRQQFCELTQTGVLILLMKKLMEKGYMF